MRMEAHILFADDNSDICELVQTLLQAAGFRVSTSDGFAQKSDQSANGANMIARASAERPGLARSDNLGRQVEKR